MSINVPNRFGGNRRLKTGRCRSMLKRYLRDRDQDEFRHVYIIKCNYLRVLKACSWRLSNRRGSGATPSFVAIGTTNEEIK